MCAEGTVSEEETKAKRHRPETGTEGRVLSRGSWLCSLEELKSEAAAGGKLLLLVGLGVVGCRAGSGHQMRERRSLPWKVGAQTHRRA